MASKTIVWDTATSYFDVELVLTEGTKTGNTTTLSWTLRLRKMKSYNYRVNQSQASTTVHINGTKVFDGNTAFDFSASSGANTTDNLASGSINVTHSADGTKTVSVSFTLSTITSSIGSPSGSGSWTLTRIPKAPGTPTLGTISSITSSGFSVAFSAPSDNGGSAILDYRMEVSKFEDFSVIDEAKTITSTPVVFIGKSRGTNYWVRVRARNAIGSSTYTSGKKVTTLHTVPDKPTAPTVSSITTNSAVLATPNPTYVGAGVTEREIQILQNGVVVQTLTTLNPTVTALTRVTNYTARHRIKNAIGWSEFSDAKAFSTIGSVPSAPSSYFTFDVASESLTVSLGTLVDNGGATPSQARVKVSTTASDAGLVQTVTNPQWAPIRIDNLTKGTQYYVAEAAYNSVAGGGWGPYGSWVQVTTLSNVPGSPLLEVDSISDTSATLTWAEPDLNGAEILSYKLLLGRNKSLTGTTNEYTLNPDVFARVLSDLTSGVQYFAAVWSVADTGKGSISEVVSFTTTSSGGSSSGLWMNDESGVPHFVEVWINDESGIPRLCEVWINDEDGIPRLSEL